MAVTYIGKSAHVSSVTSINVGVPSGYAEDDLLVLLLMADSGEPPLPSGWTLIDYGSLGYVDLKVCYKIASSSESSVNVANPGDSVRGIMLCYRNVDTTTPINSSAITTIRSISLSFAAPTTTKDGCLVIVAVGLLHLNQIDTTNLSGWANSSLESITEGHDYMDWENYGGGLAFAYGFKTIAGAINNTLVIQDQEENCVGITFAINAFPTPKVLTATINATTSFGDKNIGKKVDSIINATTSFVDKTAKKVDSIINATTSLIDKTKKTMEQLLAIPAFILKSPPAPVLQALQKVGAAIRAIWTWGGGA